MSNTDGEDTQKVSLGELLLNAGTRIVDLEKQSNDQVEIITHLEKQLASLREHLAGAEQQIKSLNEIIENLMNDEKDDMINLREQLATEQDMCSTAEFANRMIIKDLNEKLKQKEDENRELKKSISVLLDELMYESTTGDFWMWARSNERVPDRIMKIRNDNLSA